MTDPTMQMEYNVYLGQTYILVKVAWAVLRPKKTIGASCKNAEQPLKLGNRGHVIYGSSGVYSTNTKINKQTIGLSGLKRVCESSPFPIVIIGGIVIIPNLCMANCQMLMMSKKL